MLECLVNIHLLGFAFVKLVNSTFTIVTSPTTAAGHD
jgi:hypothetical protein